MPNEAYWIAIAALVLVIVIMLPAYLSHHRRRRHRRPHIAFEGIVFDSTITPRPKEDS